MGLRKRCCFKQRESLVGLAVKSWLSQPGTLDTWKVNMQPFPYGNTYWSKNPWVSFIPGPSPSTKWFQYRTFSIDLTETTLQLHQIRSTCLLFAWRWCSSVVTPLPTKTCSWNFGELVWATIVNSHWAYAKDLWKYPGRYKTLVNIWNWTVIQKTKGPRAFQSSPKMNGCYLYFVLLKNTAAYSIVKITPDNASCLQPKKIKRRICSWRFHFVFS